MRLQFKHQKFQSDAAKAVTRELFLDKVIRDARGNETVIDSDTATAIYYDLITNQYIDKKGSLTDKYYIDKANGHHRAHHL